MPTKLLERTILGVSTGVMAGLDVIAEAHYDKRIVVGVTEEPVTNLDSGKNSLFRYQLVLPYFNNHC